MSEAVRCLKPLGRILLAESSTTFAEVRQRFQRLAGVGELTVDTLRDVSDGARRSLREQNARASRAVACVPRFLRRSVGELLIVEGSERSRRGQVGELCFAMAVLRRQAAGR
ncbi:hypothetical protein [uncultured Reyranella sp.]|uniref:hypothetical protein n=1 Tax=uncultured Reyranella sp. TaxID=735512 RepID=UPI0025FD535B|nr:hypothetical protein [uncultured Reyranella sp.]